VEDELSLFASGDPSLLVERDLSLFASLFASLFV
jgi:hypothetical protein